VKGTVIVTGAGGFIGPHLVGRLIDEGADVVAIGRNAFSPCVPLPNVPRSMIADIMDLPKLVKIFNDTRPSMVFHLAAAMGGPPREMITTNTMGTFNVLEASVAAGVSRVVNVSTADVYGPGSPTPRDESSGLRPANPYGGSKLAGELVVKSFIKTRGLSAVNVRPFLVYGPGQIGSRMLIPYAITQALAGLPIDAGDGAYVRDPLYVTDAVEGIVRAATRPLAAGKDINLGTGRAISVQQIIRQITGTVNKGSVVNFGAVPRRATDITNLVASTRLSAELLDFRPVVSLEEGINRTVAWFRENGPAAPQL